MTTTSLLQDHPAAVAAAATSATTVHEKLNLPAMTTQDHHQSDTGGRPAKEEGERALGEVCDEIRDKVDAFLGEEPSTPLLKQVQEQVRISLGVVEEALTRYE